MNHHAVDQKDKSEAKEYLIVFRLSIAQPFTEHFAKPLAKAVGDLILLWIEKVQITIEQANERLL